tara:strand:+ start:49 stop:369 length:321 start_codon:yes stop_codon:yes gene_type:complete
MYITLRFLNSISKIKIIQIFISIKIIYEISLQLNKDKPLLESLSEILDIDKQDLIIFKNINPKDLKSQYSTLKTTFLPKLLNYIFKDDSKTISYWIKHLNIINDFI